MDTLKIDPFFAAALDSAVGILRHMAEHGELPDDTLPEEDLTAGWLALALTNVGLPPGTGTLDALLRYAGL